MIKFLDKLECTRGNKINKRLWAFYDSNDSLCFKSQPKKESKTIKEIDGEVYLENGLPKKQKGTLRTIFSVVGFGKEYFEYAVKSFEEKFPNVTIHMRWIDEVIIYINQ